MSKDALIFTSTVPFAPVSMKLCWPTGQSEGKIKNLPSGSCERRSRYSLVLEKKVECEADCLRGKCILVAS